MKRKPDSKPDITNDSHKRRRSRSRSRDRSPPRKKSHRSRSYSYSSSSSYSRSPSPKRTAKEKWLGSIPEEHQRFIKTVANRVKEHGKGFEGVLMEKEKENPKFAFLYDDKASPFFSSTGNICTDQIYSFLTTTFTNLHFHQRTVFLLHLPRHSTTMVTPPCTLPIPLRILKKSERPRVNLADLRENGSRPCYD